MVDAFCELISGCSEVDQAAISSGNAASLYRV